MQTAAPSSTHPLAFPRLAKNRTVCVVDPKAEDYQAWRDAAQADGLRFEIVASAEDALRVARSQSVDLWVVNIDLPGLSGFELCQILKTRSSRTAVYLVADQYSPETEQRAWAARATLFGCKPGHMELIDSFFRVSPMVQGA